MTTSADLTHRIHSVVAATFGVPPASITRETGSHSLASWDSMNHIHLIVALEAEFGVSFEPERAIELTTVGAIEQAIAQALDQALDPPLDQAPAGSRGPRRSVMAVIRPATSADLDAVSRYLAGALRGGGPERYRRFLDYTWLRDKPDLGVLLEDGGRIRGFIGAIYAERAIAGARVRCCNLTSVAVDESHRGQTLQLFGALLARKDLTFTCFSASPRVAKILDFFKFQRCANDRVVVAPISRISALRHLAARPRVRVIAEPAALDAALARNPDPALGAISRDHAGYRCGRLLLERGDRRCFLVTVRRGRGVRAFADVLHASDPALLLAHLPWIHGPLLRSHGTVLTGIDRRWVAAPPLASFAFTKLRPIYARSPTVALEQIDALYSELVPMYG